jgi:Tfp pilus assembly protein PilN
MAQQINLCTPIFLTQKRYFSAYAMLQALAVFLLLGGTMAAYWVRSLQSFSDTLEQTIATNQSEVDRIQAALKVNKAMSGPAESTFKQELQARRMELKQREELLEQSQRGLFREGFGHSARLQLVAQTIPAQVWVTEIKSDSNRLELIGSTLEPAALNDWVKRLAASPLMQGQSLATVKVERAPSQMSPRAGNVTGPAGAAIGSGTAYWTFSLVNSMGTPVVAPGAGGKP